MPVGGMGPTSPVCVPWNTACTETIPLTAELSGGFITVIGKLENILLADYDIDQPRAAVVLSVEDNAIMELQLFFSR